jgi:hypothetical protein
LIFFIGFTITTYNTLCGFGLENKTLLFGPKVCTDKTIIHVNFEKILIDYYTVLKFFFEILKKKKKNFFRNLCERASMKIPDTFTPTDSQQKGLHTLSITVLLKRAR